MRLKHLLACVISAGTMVSANATALFQLDSLIVWRNAGANLPFDVAPPSSALVLNDNFDDGIAPPFGPGGVPRYQTAGNFAGAEHGGVVDFSRSREAFTSIGT